MPLQTLRRRFGWREARLRRSVARLAGEGLLVVEDDALRLTAVGEAEIARAGGETLAHPL